MIKDTEAIAIYVLQEARISPSMEWCVDNSCLQKKKACRGVCGEHSCWQLNPAGLPPGFCCKLVISHRTEKLEELSIKLLGAQTLYSTHCSCSQAVVFWGDHILTWHLWNLPPTTVYFLCVSVGNGILEMIVQTVNMFMGVICHILLSIKARLAYYHESNCSDCWGRVKKWYQI